MLSRGFGMSICPLWSTKQVSKAAGNSASPGIAL